MTMHRLEQTQLVPASLPRVFEFFAAAENLERLSPDFLSFKIRTPLPMS